MKLPCDRRGFWALTGAAVLALALVAPWASSAPDGLEHTAQTLGLQAGDTAGPTAALANYETPGVRSQYGSRALAGGVGVALVLGAALLLSAWRRPRPAAQEPRA